MERLIEELGRLPGVGPRTAERLAFYILRNEPARAVSLGVALDSLHAGVRPCETCFNFSEGPECEVCASAVRERNVIAVVEEPFDVVAIEKTGQYHGLYHVLGGVISPVDGISPQQLQISSLITRINAGGIDEIILATNPSLEGESTAMYILLIPLPTKGWLLR
ncbi:MAG TPA: recombination mediator RecR [Candidatus Saccharimonadia bacterium]|nr:recombination mediator RecR [Candidatus Saccharimonadia bacterium]